MRDWLSYRLSDLLLFSPRTYYRMFELYHEAIWPAQLFALALIVAIVVLLCRDDEWRGVAIAAILAMSWLWVAVAFQLRCYASINWAARYFAVLFVVEAVLLIWYGVVQRRLTFDHSARKHRWLGSATFIVAVVLPPLVGGFADRTWPQVEVFALTPDATAVATLALVLVCAQPASRVLAVAPLAWCAIGGATLWAMASREAWVSIAATLVGVLVMLRTTSRRAPSRLQA